MKLTLEDQPKHEHKIAGVAWLMSQWFEEPKP